MIKSKNVFTKAPYSMTQEFDRLLDLYGKIFGVVDKHDYATFYATLLAEAGERAVIKEENLNYSTKSLKVTFKAFRDRPDLAYKYGRSSTWKADYENIGNIAYGNRMGNNNIGDGYKFRGRGFIQLTGKDNYTSVSKFILKIIGVDFMFDKYPEIVGTETGAVMSSLGFWGMNSLKDKSIDEVTKKVNRYTDSYAKRRQYYNALV